MVSRQMNQVLERQRISSRQDLYSLIEGPLPEAFSTADLAAAMGQPRRLAQKMAYCLRVSGAAELCGKAGNALLYRRLAAS